MGSHGESVLKSGGPLCSEEPTFKRKTGRSESGISVDLTIRRSVPVFLD
jgi:hypothetical protein